MTQREAHVIIGSQICKYFIEQSWQYEAAESNPLPLYLTLSLSLSLCPSLSLLACPTVVILVNAMPIKPLLDGAVYFDTS